MAAPITGLRLRAGEAASRLRAELGGLATGLDEARLEGHARAVRANTRGRGIPQAHTRLAEELEREAPVAVPVLNRWILARLATDFEPAGSSTSLPASTAPLYREHIERILADLETLGDDAFATEDPGFHKDLGLLTGHYFPTGPMIGQLAWVHPRIARTHGPGQAWKFVRVLGWQCRGLRPFVSLHIHERVNRALPEEEWGPFNMAAAEVAVLNPGIRGLIAAGWMIDPKMAEISPHLHWLVSRTLEAGGSVFFLREERTSESRALVKSETRRRLFEEGRYVPEIWMRVWPRRQFLGWARRQPEWREPEPLRPGMTFGDEERPA